MARKEAKEESPAVVQKAPIAGDGQGAGQRPSWSGGGGGWGGGGMGMGGGWGGGEGGGGGMGMGGGGMVMAPPGGWSTIVQSLRIRDFRIYMIGMLFSFIGMQMGMVARQWLVYDLTGSAAALGIVGAVSGIPMLLLSIPGGVLADRMSKRNLLIIAQSATGILAFILGFLIVTHQIQVWHIIVAAIVGGAVMTFNMPARSAMVAELVGPENLMNAIALSSSGMNLTRIIAPVAAGVLVAGVGLAATYFTYATSYVIVVILLLMLPKGFQRMEQWRHNPMEDALEGVRYLRSNRLIASLMLLAVAPAIFAMPYMMLLPVYAKDILKVGSQGLGLMMSVTGVGALLGSLVIASLGDFQQKGKVLLWGSVGFGLMVSLFALSPWFPLSLFLLAIMGLASNASMAMNQTVVMLAIPEELRGRVMGIWMMTWGFMPLGMLPVGFLGEWIGVPAVLAGGGALMVLTILVVWSLIPELRRLDELLPRVGAPNEAGLQPSFQRPG